MIGRLLPAWGALFRDALKASSSFLGGLLNANTEIPAARSIDTSEKPAVCARLSGVNITNIPKVSVKKVKRPHQPTIHVSHGRSLSNPGNRALISFKSDLGARLIHQVMAKPSIRIRTLPMLSSISLCTRFRLRLRENGREFVALGIR